MNYIDLLHGIGGFALGAYWSGMKFENHFCSDIEPYAQELYKLRFPDSIQLGDITRIDTQELKNKYPGEWILSGGFPCQDISIAGKGAGIHGKRSGLWFEYWRLINDLRPIFAVMENVGMLVHRGLREVLGSLAEIGYNAEWQDIRAEDVGAPHKRERIWIVAYPGQLGEGNTIIGFNREQQHCPSTKVRSKKRDRFTDSSKEISDTALKLPHGSREEGRGRGESADSSKEISDTIRNGLQGVSNRENIAEKNESLKGGETSRAYNERKLSDSDNSKTERQREYGRKILSEPETKRFDTCGCSEWWAIEPAVGRLAYGIPHRVDRLKGLGNSIVPQIAEILFRQIKELL